MMTMMRKEEATANVQECRRLPPSLPGNTELITAAEIAMATAFLPGSMAVVMREEEEEEGWRESEGSENSAGRLQGASPCSASPLFSTRSDEPEAAFGIMGCSGCPHKS